MISEEGTSDLTTTNRSLSCPQTSQCGSLQCLQSIFLALEAVTGGSKIKGNLDYIGLCLEGRKKLNKSGVSPGIAAFFSREDYLRSKITIGM